MNELNSRNAKIITLKVYCIGTTNSGTWNWQNTQHGIKAIQNSDKSLIRKPDLTRHFGEAGFN